MEKAEKLVEGIIKTILVKGLHIKISEIKLSEIFQFMKFGIVGLSNTLISYAVYITLVAFNWYYLFASFMGFLVSVINAFYWNNKYVFKVEEGERMLWSSFVKTFTSYAGTGLILHNILLILWVDILGLHEFLGPILNLFITIPLNFLLNKYWAFKGVKKHR